MIFLIILALLLCFLMPAFYGAPFVPTLPRYVDEALDMLELQPGDMMLELGCGTGTVVIAAARRGYRVVGYELNPVLAGIAWVRTRRYGKQVTIVWGNFFKKNLPPAQGIFCFMMPKFMKSIERKVIESQLKGVKLVSFAMPISGKTAKKQTKGVYMYTFDTPRHKMHP